MFKFKNIVLFITLLFSFTLSFGMQQQGGGGSSSKGFIQEQEPEKPICPICLEPIEDIDLAQTLPCHSINNQAQNHTFHMGCIDSWLINHNKCAFCQTEVGLFRVIDIETSNILNAAYENDLEAIRYFIAQAKNNHQPINPTINSDGTTPLFIAAYHGYLNIVKFIITQLLEQDPHANINPARTSDDAVISPLDIATENGHFEIAQYLQEVLNRQKTLIRNK